MYILELPSFFPPHGGLFCLDQARALQSLGHKVRIVSAVELGVTLDRSLWLTAPWGEEHICMEGIEVSRRFMRALPKCVEHNIRKWVQSCCRMAEADIARHGKPDILHAHCCKMAGVAARQIAAAHNIPYVITEHLSSGLFERDFGKGWSRHRWLLPLLQQAYKDAACVVPVSRELVDDLAPFFGTDYRYRPISNIIDTDFFTFRHREPLQGRPFRYCCLAVANIHGKGYDVLSEAMRLMPGGTELHIAGRGTDGDAMRRLFDGIRGVTLHGCLDKEGVRQLLWQCDALVLPTRSEAQPLVVMEAMATGIPVVGTECIPACQRIEEACLTVPKDDAVALCRQMQQVQYIQPSPKFAEAVQTIASPKAVARQIEEVMREAYSQR